MIRLAHFTAAAFGVPLLVISCAAFAAEQGAEAAASQVRAYVTNFAGDGVTVIDPVMGLRITDIATGSKPHGVAVAPDGATVYVSNEGDGTLSFIDPKTHQVTDTIEVGGTPNQIAVSADNRHVFVTLHDAGALAVVDAAARRVVRMIPVGRTPHIALRSPDGKTIYVTSEGDMKLVAMDAQSWQVTAEAPLFAWPRVLAMPSDGSRIYQTIRWLNGALVIDPRKEEVVDRITLGERHFASQGMDAHGLAITPDDHELWLTTQTTNDVTVFDAETHRILGRIQVGVSPNWVAFTPDGKLAVVSNTGSNTASIIEVATRKVKATVPVGASPKRLAVAAVQTAAQASPPPLDAQAIGEAAGTKVTVTDDGVARIGWTRDDVPVSIDGMKFPPAAGLGSWAAFMPTERGAMVMGDTVVFQDEVSPAMDAAFAHGLEVTALHNHFFFDEPKVYFMHIGGHGDPRKLAEGVKAVWDAVKQVRQDNPQPAERFGGPIPQPGEGRIDPQPIERITGLKPSVNPGGVVKVSMAYESRMHGATFSGSMGLTSWAAFSGSDDLAAIDGDFAMTAREVQPVLRAMRENGLHVVALHNHMVGESPAYYFVHFWATGPTSELADAFKSVLDAQSAVTRGEMRQHNR